MVPRSLLHRPAWSFPARVFAVATTFSREIDDDRTGLHPFTCSLLMSLGEGLPGMAAVVMMRSDC